MNILGLHEKKKILEYYDVIKNIDKPQTKYYMLTILRNEMTNGEINNFNNYLLDKFNIKNIKNIKIKYLIFQDNFFLLFILELNDDDHVSLYRIKNIFDIINIISKEHYDIILDENNNDSCLLKTAYLYSIKKILY